MFNLWRAIKLKTNERGAFVFIEFDCFPAIRLIHSLLNRFASPLWTFFSLLWTIILLIFFSGHFSIARMIRFVGDHLALQFVHCVTSDIRRVFTIHERIKFCL